MRSALSWYWVIWFCLAGAHFDVLLFCFLLGGGGGGGWGVSGGFLKELFYMSLLYFYEIALDRNVLGSPIFALNCRM